MWAWEAQSDCGFLLQREKGQSCFHDWPFINADNDLRSHSLSRAVLRRLGGVSERFLLAEPPAEILSVLGEGSHFRVREWERAHPPRCLPLCRRSVLCIESVRSSL